MVSSMQAILKSAGVNEDNIHAEEFTGFNLNEIINDTRRSWASYLPLFALALVVIGLVIVHTTGANSVFHSGLT